MRLPRFIRRVRFALVWAAVVSAAAGPARPLRAEPAGGAEPGADWSMFRGNPQLTGVARSPLPEKPELLWRFSAGEAVTSSAAIVGDAVYVGSDDGFLVALALADGSVRWKHTTESAVRSSPGVFDGVVYFGDEVGRFYALDAASGAVRWTFTTGAEVVSSANRIGERIFFGSYDGTLYCLAPADGKVLWKFEAQDRIHGTPGTDGEHALIAGCDGLLRVVQLTDGQQVREIPLNAYSGASAAIDGPRVYVGTFENEVLGIDWRAGSVLWRFQDPERQFPFLSSAAVTRETIFIGGRDKCVRALEAASGKEQWKFVTGSRVESSPVVVGERLFVGSSDGKLYALRLRDGSEQWSFEAGAPLSASPAVGRGRLVIGAEDGTVYCFGAREGERAPLPPPASPPASADRP